MPRFFALAGSKEGFAYLSDEEMHHAKNVMRLKENEEISLNVDGRVFAARFRGEGEMALLEELPSPEPSLRVTLYQGIPKGDKMDYIVQKCVEAGVTSIVPVSMHRCVSKWEGKDADKKVTRLNRIAHEAAKQSGRALSPEVEKPLTFKQLLTRIQGEECPIVPWENMEGFGPQKLVETWEKTPRSLAVVIGPEGGISEDEIEQLKAAGAQPVTLGKRIFRTETAGLAAVIAVMALSGNME